MSKSIKDILGWAVIIIMGMPSLMVSIWAVGAVAGIINSRLITVIPQDILSNLPVLAQTALREAQKPGAVKNNNTGAWIKAAGKTNKDIKEVMDESGLSTWLITDLSQALSQLEPMFNGEQALTNIEVDMEPFKKALTNETVKDYFMNVVDNLPECTVDQVALWKNELAKTQGEKEIPACNPGNVVITQVWDGFSTQVSKIPNMGLIGDLPARNAVKFNFFGWINRWVWLMFLIPILSLGAGVWLIGENTGQRLKSGGWIVGAVGGGALLTGLLVRSASRAAMLAGNFGSWQVPADSPWGWEFYSSVSRQIGQVISPTFEQILGPVINLAVIILVIGVGMVLASRDLAGIKKQPIKKTVD